MKKCEKHEKADFQPAFGVPSTQIPVKIHNIFPFSDSQVLPRACMESLEKKDWSEIHHTLLLQFSLLTELFGKVLVKDKDSIS